jgi:CRP-like cAMP-binding protein
MSILRGTVTWPFRDDEVSRSEFPAGATLFRQGQRAQAIYFVESGVVRLVRRNDEREVLVGVRGNGSVLGCTPALLDTEHVTSGFTLTSCQLLTVTPSVFKCLLERDHAAVIWMVEVLAKETHRQITRLADLLGSQGRSRLEGILVDLFSVAYAQRSDGSWALQIGITSQELADTICLTREQTSRLLAELQDAGVILKTKGRLFLPIGSPLIDKVTDRLGWARLADMASRRP